MITLQPPPGPSQPNPSTVRELAERQLRSSPHNALKNVTCDFQNGVLALRGSLPTYYLKQVAQELVGRSEGVNRIANEIQVVPSTSRSPQRLL